MAQSKPIIATGVGGVPDLVTEDVGILVPPDDIAAMVNAMVRLANDSDLRQRLGSAARKKYERLFTPAMVLPVLIDFYERVRAKHSSGSNGHGSSLVTHEWLNT